MPRETQEWIGKTDDTDVPPRVRLRVWIAKGGICHRCKRTIPTGDAWICEHLKALINGGENRERNLDLTCSWCKPQKDAEDVAEKSHVAERAKSHFVGRKKRTMRRWRRMDGTIVEAPADRRERPKVVRRFG